MNKYINRFLNSLGYYKAPRITLALQSKKEIHANKMQSFIKNVIIAKYDITDATIEKINDDYFAKISASFKNTSKSKHPTCKR